MAIEIVSVAAVNEIVSQTGESVTESVRKKKLNLARKRVLRSYSIVRRSSTP